MSLQILQQLAWVIAGASVGILTLTMVAALVSSQRTPETGAKRREIWTDLLASLDSLQRNPDSPAARAGAVEALSKVGDADNALELVSLLLSLEPQHNAIGDLVREAGLVSRIVLELENGTTEQKIGTLELIGLAKDRSHLSTVLVHCTSSEPTVRRIALRMLSDISPVSALDLHVRATRTEGPWVLEQLVELVREPDNVSQYRALHGDRRLADVIALLAGEISEGDERRALAAIEALRLIDHRATTNALTRGLRSSSPVLADAARRALLITPAGRVVVDQVSGRAGPSTVNPVESAPTNQPVSVSALAALVAADANMSSSG